MQTCTAKEREEATALFTALCQSDGRIYMDDLEDYLVEEFPKANHFDFIREFDDAAAKDHLYDGTGITKEVRRSHACTSTEVPSTTLPDHTNY